MASPPIPPRPLIASSHHAWSWLSPPRGKYARPLLVATQGDQPRAARRRRPRSVPSFCLPLIGSGSNPLLMGRAWSGSPSAPRSPAPYPSSCASFGSRAIPSSWPARHSWAMSGRFNVAPWRRRHCHRTATISWRTFATRKLRRPVPRFLPLGTSIDFVPSPFGRQGTVVRRRPWRYIHCHGLSFAVPFMV